MDFQGCVKGVGTVHLVDRVLTLNNFLLCTIYCCFVYIGTVISWQEYIKAMYLLRVHVPQLDYFCYSNFARLRNGDRTRTVNCARYPKLYLLYTRGVRNFVVAGERRTKQKFPIQIL